MQDGRGTDGRTDGQTDGQSETNIPPNNFVVRGYDKATALCSDRMSGSYFIVQTIKFLLINATALTLGQGHGKSSSTFSQTYIFFVPNI